MNRNILLITIIPILALIGKIIAEKYTNKRKFLEDFLFFLTLLENEINFTLNELGLIINNLKDGEFKDYLIKRVNNQTVKISYLSKNEFSILDKFLYSIGKIDKFSQKDMILDAKNSIKNYYEEAKLLEKRNSTLYFKLGILIGLLIYILLI